jgi:hypothetical protein
MKTSHLIGLGLVALGVYYYYKSRPKAEAPKSNPNEPKANAVGYNTIPIREEGKANATGFEIPTSDKKIFTTYGRI